MKKTFEIKIKIKNCPIEFKEGLGEGVLISQEYSYDLEPKEYNSGMFALSLLNEGKALVEEVIDIQTREIE